MKILRGYLIFGGVYMLVESFVHFFNFKLLDVQTMWSNQALVYSGFIGALYGSLSLFVAMILFFAQKNLQQNQSLIKLLAVFSLLHAIFLFYSSFSTNFDQFFIGAVSLKFWLPNYNFYLLFEAMLLFSFTFIVFRWSKEKK